MKRRTILASAAMATIAVFILAGCKNNVADNESNGKIIAVGAENEYADVISQIGGKYVSAIGIMNNPETDPHSYEANTGDASLVNKATLIVQNGLGYDDFMNKLESSSSHSKRQIITVAKALNESARTKNPHLWYNPNTMPKVASLIAKDLEKQKPAQKQYFEEHLKKFDASLKQWQDAIKVLKNTYAGTGVAVTEPVADYLVEAAGLTNETPWNYQAAVMNGVDPSPQDVKTQQNLFNNKKVKVFLYNRQAVDNSTTALLALAEKNKIPVVGVYETMPENEDYQNWMEQETSAIFSAIKQGKSTEKLS